MGTAEGMLDRGRALNARSCPYDDIDSTEVCCGPGDRVYQREKRDPHSSAIQWQGEKLCRTAFLGERIFRLDGWKRRRSDSHIHTTSGTRRSQNRSIKTDVNDPFGGARSESSVTAALSGSQN